MESKLYTVTFTYRTIVEAKNEEEARIKCAEQILSSTGGSLWRDMKVEEYKEEK